MARVRPLFSMPFIGVALLLLLLLSACGQQPVATPKNVPVEKSTYVTPVKQQAKTGAYHTGSHSITSTPVVVPVHLVIPAIGVNAAIEEVGIAADGDLSTPMMHPWDDAGWYDLGTRPGEQGSSVIDGHLDRPGGYPAVFWNLRYLHSGDRVIVVESQGKALQFRVLQVAFYSPQTAPLQNIYGNTTGKYLNLITCAGDWIPSQHQTTLRLVVYTQLVP
ncbi:MAG TPA: class F sortase [Ktedonobacteraceae bacterium]|nr:class F sortase [Ktedonobacteraceae bacterium]